MSPSCGPRSAVAIMVHWGDPGPTLDAADRYWSMDIFKGIVIVANDATTKPPGVRPDIDWIVAPRNLGYGSACNLAVASHFADRYAIFNTDLEIAAADVEACLAAIEAPEVGIAGPVLRNQDGSVNSAGGRFSHWTGAPVLGLEDTDRVVTCDWVTGAAFFATGGLLRNLPFDGSYFLGYEDADLCRRAKAQGIRIVVVPATTAVHRRGHTMGGNRWPYYTARNRLWYTRRQGSTVRALLSTVDMARRLPRVAIADVANRRGFPSHARLALRGFRAGWSQLPATGHPLPDEPIAKAWVPW